ncbi:manganese superoxide dismutase [Penicillium samsonianum]|uniref:manganese superoxide dismutase n=1 Tax=Penicillium samsonianum TaxID=1882272 RepID=UPI0025485BEA|nr:manganese superoxide dismutase [Penicillium samsonianum]KAJ6137400.1 manganese superoxide dismutase [Penicillium samsonianum]
MASQTHTLPPLPYAYDALEPVISKQIMELHHQKHHQTYINNLNAALSAQASATASNDVPTLIALQQKLRFNGGGHINHSLFWKNLTPPAHLGMTSAALPLCAKPSSPAGARMKHSSRPLARSCSDPVNAPDVPVFGVDMWEHAYYLQYLNNKAGYVEGIWKIIHWAEAEKRYTAGVENPLKL